MVFHGKPFHLSKGLSTGNFKSEIEADVAIRKIALTLLGQMLGTV